jgi:hypothetical protein
MSVNKGDCSFSIPALSLSGRATRARSEARMTPTKLPVVQRLIAFAVAIAGLLSATHRRRPIGRIDRAWDWRGSSRCMDRMAEPIFALQTLRHDRSPERATTRSRSVQRAGTGPRCPEYRRHPRQSSKPSNTGTAAESDEETPRVLSRGRGLGATSDCGCQARFIQNGDHDRSTQGLLRSARAPSSTNGSRLGSTSFRSSLAHRARPEDRGRDVGSPCPISVHGRCSFFEFRSRSAGIGSRALQAICRAGYPSHLQRSRPHRGRALADKPGGGEL